MPLVTLALLAVTATGQQDGVVRLLTCEVRFVQAPRSEVIRLFPKVGETVAPETLRQLQQWIGLHRAKILAQPTVSTVSGAQADCRAFHNVESVMDGRKISQDFGVSLIVTPVHGFNRERKEAIFVTACASIKRPQARGSQVTTFNNDDCFQVSLANGATVLAALRAAATGSNEVVLVLVTAAADPI